MMSILILAFVLMAASASAQTVVADRILLKTGPCVERSGSGSPEGAVTGNVCDTWHQTNTPYDIWRKTSGTGNTGWVKDGIYINIQSYGAIPNDSISDQTAFQAAIDAGKSLDGLVFAPKGTYNLTATLDMTGAGTVRLLGEGAELTVLITTVTTTPGITLGGHVGTRRSGITGIQLFGGTGGLPGAQVAGNYGIQVPDAGAGSGVYISDVTISGFANHAIRIAGPTGPTTIEDAQIVSNAGYGIEVAQAVGLAPQDVTINGGSIQAQWGGIYLGTTSTSTSVHDVDIELGTQATLPAIYIAAGGGGNAFHGVTTSLAGNPNPAAVVYVEGFGNTFVGSMNVAYVVADNYRFSGSGSQYNSVTGGYHVNAGATSGYFAQVSSGTYNSFITPFRTASYAAGKDTVFNTAGAANFTTFIDGALATLPAVSTPSITTAAATNLQLIPTGDLITDPTGNDVLPNLNYDINIGMLSKKYLTLHAAELWVETLVAQNTIATIGGRVLVAVTNLLSADLAAAGTTITVKYNNFVNGDRLYMEADGKVEFMAVTSVAGGSAGAYTYTVTRNMDGTGANDWFAGDALIDTGQCPAGCTGGFIDLYSVRGIRAGTELGPTIAGNVRVSNTYNDWQTRWAIGNLNGLYGYGADTYGAAFGVPSAAWIKIDPTNGVRIGHNATTVTQIDASGNASFTGTITAAAGLIGGFSIGADYIRDAANTMGLASTVTGGDDTRFWAGNTFANRASAPFVVTEAGAMFSTSGTVGGWTLSATTLSATNITLTSGAANTAHILAGTGADAGGINSANGSSDVVFWAGSTHANRATAPFRVLASGVTRITTLNADAISLPAAVPAILVTSTQIAIGSGTTLTTAGLITSGTGFMGRAGTAGATSNAFNVYWNATCARIWIDTTDLGCIAIASDARLKREFTPINGGLTLVKQLSPGAFRWRAGVGDTERHFGLRAQDVIKVLPDLVRNTGMKTPLTPDGMRQVDYVGLIPVLVKAVQELSAEVDALKKASVK